MPEYIDKEKLIRDLIDNRSFYPVIVKKAIENAPTEDVVPRSEVEQLQRNLEQCENGYRQQIHILQCKHKDEVEKIFEEIKKILKTQEKYLYCNPSLAYIYDLIAELKKKYIGEKQ